MSTKNPFVWFYASKEVSIFGGLEVKFKDCHFDIRFDCLANHTELKKYLQFVPQNIDRVNNTKWFANYILAFDKFGYKVDTLEQRLLSNELVTIYITEDYEYIEDFRKVYDNIKIEYKQ